MVAVCDTLTGSRKRFREVGCHRGYIVAPGKAPSDLGLNVGDPTTDFSTGSRKLEDRHSVNMGLGSCVGLSIACLGG